MKKVINKKAQKYINKQPVAIRTRLIDAIDRLPDGDTTDLVNTNGYRLRVGGLRVIFDITNDSIIIRKVAPRGQIYKD